MATTLSTMPPAPAGISTRRGARYGAVAEWLRGLIDRGVLPVGERVPRQRDLAIHVGVALATLRRALEELIDDGVLEARPGVGTFVAATSATRPAALRSFDEMMSEVGLSTTTRVLASGSETPNRVIAQELRLDDLTGKRVWFVERLRCVEGVPYCWQRSVQSVLPLGPRLTNQLNRRSLSDLLRESGVTIDTACQNVRAAVTPPTIAELLEVEPGTPALVTERLARSAAGDPVLHEVIYTRGDIGYIWTDAAAATMNVALDELRLLELKLQAERRTARSAR